MNIWVNKSFLQEENRGQFDVIVEGADTALATFEFVPDTELAELERAQTFLFGVRSGLSIANQHIRKNFPTVNANIRTGVYEGINLLENEDGENTTEDGDDVTGATASAENGDAAGPDKTASAGNSDKSDDERSGTAD